MPINPILRRLRQEGHKDSLGKLARSYFKYERKKERGRKGRKEGRKGGGSESKRTGDIAQWQNTCLG